MGGLLCLSVLELLFLRWRRSSWGGSCPYCYILLLLPVQTARGLNQLQKIVWEDHAFFFTLFWKGGGLQRCNQAVLFKQSIVIRVQMLAASWQFCRGAFLLIRGEPVASQALKQRFCPTFIGWTESSLALSSTLTLISFLTWTHPCFHLEEFN